MSAAKYRRVYSNHEMDERKEKSILMCVKRVIPRWTNWKEQVQQQKVERFMSGAKYRRVYLDHEMDERK